MLGNFKPKKAPLGVAVDMQAQLDIFAGLRPDRDQMVRALLRIEKADAENLQRIPSPRTIVRLMTIARDGRQRPSQSQPSKPALLRLLRACRIIAEFHLMIRHKAGSG